jgi:hypothetical protein
LPPRFPCTQTGITGPYEWYRRIREMLADEVDYVVGVDTQRDQHALAVVATPTGAVVAQRSFPANGRGYA